MNWEAIGAVGEVLGAIGVIVTLAYLAVQIRQNTKALGSSTFQAVSAEMARTAETITSVPGLAPLLAKAQHGLDDLTEDERIRFDFAMLMVFRRLEAVHVHRELGSIPQRLTWGFERSAISALGSGGAAEWWKNGKVAFSEEFAQHVDAELASGRLTSIHPGFGRS